MVNSFYTLRVLASELNASLSGCRVGQSLSQSKSELVIPFHDDTNSPTSSVRFSIGQQRYCFEDGKFARAKRNVAELFDDARGKRVTQVSIADRDRCVFIALEDGLSIALALTGASANAYLVSDGQAIREAFSGSEELVGTVFDHTRPAPPFPSLEDWTKKLQRKVAEGKSLAAGVAASYAFFDRQIGREVVRRSGVEGHPSIVSEEDAAVTYRVAQAFDAELMENPEPVVFMDGEGVWQMALYRSESHDEVRQVSTVNEAIRRVMIGRWKDAGLANRIGPVRTRLLKLLSDRERALASLRKGLARPSRADRYQKWGDLLMTWQGTIERNVENIEVPDYYTGDGTVTIPVVTGHTRTTLGEHYYSKAKKARTRRETETSREADLAAEVEDLRSVVSEANAVEGHDDWDGFEERHSSTLKRLFSVSPAGGEGVPFRSYALPNGYVVYVGKNAKQNDRLTTSYARKEDLWLHARGVPGSHTVLRVKGREDPPANIIEAAASIAAYHSKARGSALVPVIVVKKKYVRKPKGAQQGTVTVDRENVVLVEPRIPTK